MTEVNGLRLAYRGFVTGLAASYVWLAVAMAGAAVFSHDALAPLTPLAASLVAAGDVTPATAFVLGFALVQAAGALIGMCFAYFFGRFFTVRATVAAAAPIVAVLAWALLAAGVGARIGSDVLAGQLSPVVAAAAYGLLLGLGLPLRTQVVRNRTDGIGQRGAGSPST
jgi:hypothetical protein